MQHVLTFLKFVNYYITLSTLRFAHGQIFIGGNEYDAWMDGLFKDLWSINAIESHKWRNKKDNGNKQEGNKERREDRREAFEMIWARQKNEVKSMAQ